MKGHSDYIDAMDLASNERIAVTASRDGTWRLWDVRTGRQMHCYSAANLERGFTAVAFSPDARWFTLSGGDSRCWIWETATRRIRSVVGLGDGGPAGSVAVSPDSKLIAYEAGAGNVLLKDASYGNTLHRLSGHRQRTDGIAFSPNGRWLATCDVTGVCFVWDVAALAGDQELNAEVLSQQDREEFWRRLASENPSEAFTAICHLVRDSKPVEEFLDRRLKPAPAGDAKQIARWIERLGSKSFLERDEATRQLAGAGEAATVALVAAWNSELSPEARSRVRRLLERLDAVPPPETLQTLRAIEVLERRGKPEAIPILKRLAAGAPGFTVTIDAQETLDRMEKRK
jgi:hypothetical protein